MTARKKPRSVRGRMLYDLDGFLAAYPLPSFEAAGFEEDDPVQVVPRAEYLRLKRIERAAKRNEEVPGLLIALRIVRHEADRWASHEKTTAALRDIERRLVELSREP